VELSEDNSFGDSDWQPYQSSMPFTLSSGDGQKTVYAHFRDLDGNVSNRVFNSIWLDTTSPSSAVSAFGGQQSSPNFPVMWSGADPSSGIASYDVQVRDDGVTPPGGTGTPGTWTNWKTNTVQTSGTYHGEVTHRYCFRSRAHDNAGNVEAYPSAPDACTRVKGTSSATLMLGLTNDVPMSDGQATVAASSCSSATLGSSSPRSAISAVARVRPSGSKQIRSASRGDMPMATICRPAISAVTTQRGPERRS
jgi:hypothetical protein